MRIIVCGSRHWPRERRLDIYRALNEIVEANAEPLYDDDGGLMDWNTYHWTVVHGGAPGADTIAGDWGVMISAEVVEFPADWKTHGKAAGPIRNRQMAAAGADLCVAFPLGESRGTRDMMRVAEAADIKVVTPLGDGR